jgi:hypothetical protein
MKGQLNLFPDPPPPADKPMLFKPAQRAIWTENKAKLIERYLYYFVLVTKHGAYIDGFAGPQYKDKDMLGPPNWCSNQSMPSCGTSGFARSRRRALRSWKR